MLWDVTYRQWSKADQYWADRCIQVEADTISRANTEATVLIGTRASIIRIDRAYPELPKYDPSKTKIQGAP